MGRRATRARTRLVDCMQRSMLRPMPAQMPTSLQCELRNARSLVSAPTGVNNGPYQEPSLTAGYRAVSRGIYMLFDCNSLIIIMLDR